MDLRIVCFCIALPIVLGCDVSVAGNPGADTYYTWITQCLKAIEADVPRITASAEAAAEPFVSDGYAICAWGDPPFVEEFTGRAGGIMPVSRIRPTERDVAKAIILVCPRQDRLEADLKQAARLRRPDNIVVLFAGPLTKKAAQDVDAQFDYVVHTRAAEHGGLIESDGKWIIPTDRAAAIAALWTWTGEFVGACTRLGRMPVMWQSLSVPGSEKRAAKYKRLKFHNNTPAPMRPGLLGRSYLTELSSGVQAVHARERSSIAALVRQIAEAKAAGKTFYVCGAGHATRHRPDSITDPRIFTFLAESTPGVLFQPGDLLLCNGYDAHWLDAQLGPISRQCRKLGGKVAWSLTTYGGQPVPGVERGETVIDQHWELGDAIVTVPSYDIRILPSSGVIAEAVLWMVTAEVIGRQ